MSDNHEIGKMIKIGDVKGLSQTFQRAGNWDTRETAVVALQNMVQENRAFDHAEMIEALRNIEQVCKAETRGGNYRTNCLEVAQNLLRKLNTETESKKTIIKSPEKESKKPPLDIFGKPLDPDMIMQDMRKKLMKGTVLEFMDNLDAGINLANKRLLDGVEKGIIDSASKTREGKKLMPKGNINPDKFEDLLRIGLSCASSDQIKYWRNTAIRLTRSRVPEIEKRARRILKLSVDRVQDKR
jgi:CHAT domain-containing protein